MDDHNKNLSMVRYLLSKSLEGDITAEQMQQLDTLIIEDPQARRYYVEFMQVHVNLRKLLQKNINPETTKTDDVLNVQLWQQLAHHEETAESVLIEQSSLDNDNLAMQGQYLPAKRTLRRSTIYSVIASIAAMMFIIIYISVVPLPDPIVATVTDSVNAQWETPHMTLSAGDDVRTESLRLLSGVVSLEFESGVSVLVEGPAEFKLLSSQKMFLAGGKAFAHVPDTAIGFTIDTPQSSVVDLGTEFGIAVNPLSGSDVHVYQGKVNLVAGLAQATKQSEILERSQARRVDARQGRISTITFKNYLFAREISSKLNRISYGPPLHLASFVSGGNGVTPGNQPSGIDPSTGLVHEQTQEDFNRFGDDKYNPVPDREYVDGVFVPNSASVVDSADHIFSGFPATSRSFWADITASPVLNHIALDDQGKVLYRQQFVASLSDRLQNDKENSVILLHPNSGITFDLKKIRDHHSDAEIDCFRATCGISKNALIKMDQEFWVLLDGQRVFHYYRSGEKMVSKQIDIPIHSNHSYLTLATTDAGDGNSFDWCLFEDAVLELVPKTAD